MTARDASGAVCPFHAAQEFKPFDTRDPFGFYQQARQEEPVFFSPELGYWVVTRFSDAQAIFKDPQTFSSENTQTPYKARPPEVLRVLEEGGFSVSSGLSARQPPDHTRLRSFINKAFTPRRIGLLEPRIRTLVQQMIGAFEGDGHADLVAQLSNDLPALVIFMLLGIPDEDVPNVKMWAQSRVMLNFGDLPIDDQIEHAHNLVRYWNYCLALVDSRLEHPQDDLPGDLARLAQDGAHEISRDEIASLVYTQLTAGHETTSNLIGNGLMELLRHRSQWEKLCEDSSLIPNAVEELLRFGPSVFAWRRKVKKPARVGTVDLPEGANILMLLGSTNRDEATFPEGETLDVTRANAKEHLSFGLGIHYCLGAPLARLEAKIVLEELTARLPGLRLCEQNFEFSPNTSFRGPLSVKVEWSRA